MDTPDSPSVWPPAPTLPPPKQNQPKPLIPKALLIELLIRSIIGYGLAMLIRLIIEPHSVTTWRDRLEIGATVVAISAIIMGLQALWRQKKLRL